MRTFIIACVLIAAVIARPEEKYTDRYDSINIEEILANRQVLLPYIKCLLDIGRCTPEGKELKSHIREALENNCVKCTDSQQKGSRRVIGHLINQEPEYWKQLSNKYDTEGKYTSKYESELRIIKG